MYWSFFYFQAMDRFKIPGYPDLQYGTVYCIGRNYTLHIEEMKSSKTADPVVFLKSRNSIIHSGQTIFLPQISSDVHHEAELVLLIGNKLNSISESAALDSILAYASGIDVTARDLQANAKKEGLPWSLSKGFESFAPVGNWVPFNKDNTDLNNLSIQLSVNGTVRQKDSTSNMIFPVQKLITFLSGHFTLYPGDLIFTGTPSGVAKIEPGDKIKVSVGNQDSILQVEAALKDD